MTLDQAIDAAMQLTLEEQEMLLAIVRARHIDARRSEMARDARESLNLYRSGQLKATPGESVLDKLHAALEEEE